MLSRPADILIMGGGIAGLSVAAELDRRAVPFVLSTSPSVPSASAVAAGLINPVTGRRYSVQKHFEERLQAATEIYHHLEELCGKKILHSTEITRLHRSEEARKAFDGQPERPASFIGDAQQTSLDGLLHEHGGVSILQGHQVDVRSLSGNLTGIRFRYGQVTASEIDLPFSISNGRFVTNAGTFSKIIDCSGIRSADDPFWSAVPFRRNKGEVLIIRIDTPPSSGVYIKDCILVPMTDGSWWAGAHNSWTDRSPLPTEDGRMALISALKKMLTSSFIILDHQAAFRPTIRDRAPVIGEHPKYPGLYLLNGLGTKGYSLAPYLARRLTDHLLDGRGIDPKVDVARFY